MKKSYKVVLINMLVALVISILFTISTKEAVVFFIALGTVSSILSLINLFVGVIILASGNEEWGKAFLLGGGILLLIGFGICGPMLMFSGL